MRRQARITKHPKWILYTHAGQVRQLEEAEELAVEQEDFESAASLSSELDVLRSVHTCEHCLSTERHQLLHHTPVTKQHVES